MINILTLLAVPFITTTTTPRAAARVVDDSAAMTLVVVQNERDVPVTVYVQNDLGEYKLGVVAPGDEKTLRLESYVFGRGDVQFFVQPAGQLEQSAGPVAIDRAEHIGLVVPPR